MSFLSNSPRSVSTPPIISKVTRATLMGAAGITILLTSAGVALLPVANPVGGTTIVGWLLLVVGIVEMFAGALRTQARTYSIAAGLATSIAGCIFLFYTIEHFFSEIYILIAWLATRAVMLLLSAEHSDGTVKLWLFASAATDFFIALFLLEGISISSLTVALFGPTPQIAFGFSWVVAVSLVVNGCMMLELAASEAFCDIVRLTPTSSS